MSASCSAWVGFSTSKTSARTASTCPGAVSTTFSQPSSVRTATVARAKGWDKIFERVGATLINPGCGACIGCGPGVSDTREQAGAIRAEVARVLGLIRNPTFRPMLVPLMFDADLTVAQEAIRRIFPSYRSQETAALNKARTTVNNAVNAGVERARPGDQLAFRRVSAHRFPGVAQLAGKPPNGDQDPGIVGFRKHIDALSPESRREVQDRVREQHERDDPPAGQA